MSLSFTNTPEGGLSVEQVQQEYVEAEDQIAGLEIVGTVTDGDLIRYDGSTNTWELVDGTLAVEDSGTSADSDVETLNFGTDLDVTGGGDGSVDVAAAASLLRSSNTEFSIQAVSSDVSTGGNVLNIVDSSGGARTLTISSSQESDGAIVVVKRKGANGVTVTTESGNNVNASADDTLSTDGAAKVYAYNASATNWEIVASF